MNRAAVGAGQSQQSSCEQPNEWQSIAKRFVSQAVNAVNGSLDYPITMIANYLLGHGHHFASHEAYVFRHWLFVLKFNGSADEDADRFTTTAVLTRAEDGNINVVTSRDDYIHRPQVLADLPPYLFFMAYYRIKKPGRSRAANNTAASSDAHIAGVAEEDDDTAVDGTQANSKRYDFQPGHPMHATHRLARRKQLCMLQLLCDPPVRPSPEADVAARAAYAAFVLGCFRTPKQADPAVWSTEALLQEFSTWHGQLQDAVQNRAADYKLYGLINSILDNMNDHATTRQRAAHRVAVRRAEIAEARVAGEVISSDSDMEDAEVVPDTDTRRDRRRRR